MRFNMQHARKHNLKNTSSEEDISETEGDSLQSNQLSQKELQESLEKIQASWKASTLTISSYGKRRGSVNEIGDRIEKAKKHKLNKSSSFSKRMWIVVGAIVLFFVVAHLTVFFVLEVVDNSVFPHDNHDKRFDDLGNPFDEIIKDTVPYVQQWYRGIDTNKPLLPLPRDISTTEQGDLCLDRWFRSIETSFPLTSPGVVELVLHNLGLSKSPLVRLHVHELLTEPQTLSVMLSNTTRCSRKSVPLQRLCTVMEGNTIPSLTDTRQMHAMEYLVNFYAVNEILTSTASTDIALLSELVEAMNGLRPSIEHYYEGVFSSDRANFAKVKLQGVTAGFERFRKTLAENAPFDAFNSFLQINILEAVKLEVTLGHEANARVGLALAAAVTSSAAVEDHQIRWKLGKYWVDAYIAWNLSFVVSAIPIQQVAKLFLPSMSCAASESLHGESFITSRVISLAVSLLHVSTRDSLTRPPLMEEEKLNNIQEFLYSEVVLADVHARERHALADAMGESNLKHTMLSSPFRGQVEEMLYNLCDEDCRDAAWKVTDTSPQSSLNDEDFLVYFGFIIWATVLLAGFGCELLFLVMLSKDGWSDQQETRWWFAQFLFPLLAMTTLGLAMLRNFLALPFLVVGLWKFGMPETISYMYTSLYDSNKGCTGRWTDFINSGGTALHHSAATMAISFMLVGVIPPNRHTVGAMLILIIQHWFILIKYVNVRIYYGIELVLEFFFQWVILSDLEYLYDLHWTAVFSALGMLTAHWLYLIAATIEVLSRVHKDGSIRQPFAHPKALAMKRDELDDTEEHLFEEDSYDEESYDEEER